MQDSGLPVVILQTCRKLSGAGAQSPEGLLNPRGTAGARWLQGPSVLHFLEWQALCVQTA